MRGVASSVTRFGENLQVFGKWLTVYFLFGKMLNLLWQICHISELNIVVAKGQKLKHNLTIWSHWLGAEGRAQRNDEWKAIKKTVKVASSSCHWSSNYASRVNCSFITTFGINWLIRFSANFSNLGIKDYLHRVYFVALFAVDLAIWTIKMLFSVNKRPFYAA